MFLRKVLAASLMVLMGSPLWGGAEIVGNVTSSKAATVRDTKLAAGSTVFSGDEISVDSHGATRIAFTNGAQAEVLGDSVVHLAKTDDGIQMTVDRGQVSFHTSATKGFETLLPDISVRPASGNETSGVVQMVSENHVIIAAQKGALLLTTEYDGKTYTVPEGEAANLSAAPPDAQQGGPAPAGQPRQSHRKRMIWFVALAGGAAAVTSYMLLRNQTTPSTATLQNQVSPSTLP